MLSDPGSKLDFGTLIAYLVPGYILELLIYCMVDAINIYFFQKILLENITWNAAEFAVAGASLTLFAYLLGLIFDVIAHPITLENELRVKNLAYEKSAFRFQGFIKSQEINQILLAKEDDSAKEKRNLFIDSMFYRIASPEIWARQNWHWAFYEFSRQMYLLSIPAIAIIAFYTTTAILLKASSSFIPVSTFWLSLGVTGIISVLNQFSFKRLLKEANDTDCEVYYRHRAWVIFAYLIEKGIIEKAFRDNERTEIKKIAKK